MCYLGKSFCLFWQNWWMGTTTRICNRIIAAVKNVVGLATEIIAAHITYQFSSLFYPRLKQEVL